MVDLYKKSVSGGGAKAGINVGVNPGMQPGTPPGRLPTNTPGFYTTPEVISPTDCVNYPDSPWCSGNPLDRSPIGLGVKVQIGNCGVDVTISSTLGFVKLPRHGFSYRYEGVCRNEPPKPPKPPKTSGIPNAPPVTDFPNTISDETIVIAILGEAFFSNNYASSSEGLITSYQRMRYPYGGTSTVSGQTFDNILWCKFFGSLNITYNKNWADYPNYSESRSGGLILSKAYTPSFYGNRRPGEPDRTFPRVTNLERWSAISSCTYFMYSQLWAGFSSPGTFYVMQAKYKDVKKAFLTGMYTSYEEYPIDRDTNKEVPSTSYGWSIVNVLDLIDISANYDKNPPPPFLLPEKDCCMACCDKSNDDDLRELLKKIDRKLGSYPLRIQIYDEDETRQEAQTKTVSLGDVSSSLSKTIERVEKLAKIIGIDALPLTVPESIVEPVDNNLLGVAWDFLNGTNERRITNLFEWNVWMLEQFSAVMGQWQVEIDIEDTDALKEGDQGIPSGDGKQEQKKKMVLPDVRSILREILLLQIHLYKIQGLSLDVGLKTLTETSSSKQEVVKSLMTVKQISDFLDFRTDEKTIDVPVQITVPGKDVSQEEINNLYKFLQPSNVKIKYDDWDGYDSLSDLFTHLATLLSRGRGGG